VHRLWCGVSLLMRGKVYIVAGVPGVGKSWVLNKLKNLSGVYYVPNDEYIGSPEERINEVVYGADNGLTILTETPFSESKLRQPLLDEGLSVTTVFIVEPEAKLIKRYEEDRKQWIPKGHLSRQKTYEERAKATGAFCGTSDEVLEHLRKVLNRGN